MTPGELGLDRRLAFEPHGLHDDAIVRLHGHGDRFDEYERQIRAEYAQVPEALFREKRGEVLRSFVDRAAIYATPTLHDRFEAAARANLRRAIDRLA